VRIVFLDCSGPISKEKPVSKITDGLVALIRSHDPKRDLSYRLEGTLQAVTVLAKNSDVTISEAKQLADAIIETCSAYRQTEGIGQGREKVEWPTNHYALETLAALGIPKPEAQKIA